MPNGIKEILTWFLKAHTTGSLSWIQEVADLFFPQAGSFAPFPWLDQDFPTVH